MANQSRARQSRRKQSSALQPLPKTIPSQVCPPFINHVEIQPQQVTIGSGLGAVFFAFIVLGLVVSLCFHIYFYIHRNEKVVKKTSPVFGQLILFGIDMVLISQILWEVSQ
jgi:hypothetical protein